MFIVNSKLKISISKVELITGKELWILNYSETYGGSWFIYLLDDCCRVFGQLTEMERSERRRLCYTNQEMPKISFFLIGSCNGAISQPVLRRPFCETNEKTADTCDEKDEHGE